MAVSGEVEFHAKARPKHAAIRRLLAGSAGLIAAALHAVLWAQATPQIPTREEIQRPSSLPAVPPSEQIVAIDDGIERAPCPLANPEFANVRFPLRGVQFSRVEGIDNGLLALSWSDRVEGGRQDCRERGGQ